MLLSFYILGYKINKSSLNTLTFFSTAKRLLSSLIFFKVSTALRGVSLMDLTAVDRPGKLKRFNVFYMFLNFFSKIRYFLVLLSSEVNVLASAQPLFSCANWAERELFDMFGVHFGSHTSLKRLLLDYGFNGHPLRKDFPLSGFVEVCYSDVEKRIQYNFLELSQEFRDYFFIKTW